MKYAAALLLGLTIAISPVHSEESSQTESPLFQMAFVDFDGDGIDDRFLDTDRDGLPDRLVLGATAQLTASIDNSGLFEQFGPGANGPQMDLPKPTEFDRRLSAVQCLCADRGGFGSSEAFGPGNGIGVTAVTGTVCVGGICF